MLKIRTRKFKKEDIPYKVKWINDSNINKYLHYSLPLEEEKTLIWFENNKDNKNRIDATIEVEIDEKITPVGLIGLLGIDNTNKKAEFYICMGDATYHNKGVAKEASNIFIKEVFETTDINKIYLYTEKENIKAQRLFEKIRFKKEGLLMSDLIYNQRVIDRYVYGLIREDFVYEN